MNATTTTPADLLAGLAGLVAAEDLSVGKDGFNKHFNYGYMTEQALFNAARAALAEVGLSGTISFEGGQHEIIPTWNKEGQERPGILATVTAVLTVRDQQGNSVDCRAFGQGLDNADKAYYKAMTGAAKYVVQKALLIAVDGAEDTDSQHSGSVAGRGSGAPMSGAASEKQLGFVCSLIKKHHITGDATVEATALRFARMQGDPATEFNAISKQTASDLIERFQKLPDGRGQEALERLQMWEAENGYAATPSDDDVPFQQSPASSPAVDASGEEIPFG